MLAPEEPASSGGLIGCVLIRLALLCGVAVVVAPFLISSLYVDQRGVEMTGARASKREDVTTRYAGWTRTSEVTVEYDSRACGGGVLPVA
jgi:hypothetical protein